MGQQKCIHVRTSNIFQSDLVYNNSWGYLKGTLTTSWILYSTLRPWTPLPLTALIAEVICHSSVYWCRTSPWIRTKRATQIMLTSTQGQTILALSWADTPLQSNMWTGNGGTYRQRLNIRLPAQPSLDCQWFGGWHYLGRLLKAYGDLPYDRRKNRMLYGTKKVWSWSNFTLPRWAFFQCRPFKLTVMSPSHYAKCLYSSIYWWLN